MLEGSVSLRCVEDLISSQCLCRLWKKLTENNKRTKHDNECSELLKNVDNYLVKKLNHLF